MSSPVETRLLDGAARLFYERGIAASGVDAISAVSGVSKPTLYGHFGTKSALVAMVLERQHQQRRASLEEHLAARSALAPAGRLLSVFDWIAAHQCGDWRRGCPFVNASVELVRPADGTAREAVRRHKRWFRGVLAGLAEEAEVADPVAMASQLHLLIEGANARMLAEGDAAAIGDARRAAGVLLAAASHRGGAYGHAQPGEVTGAHVPGSRRTRRGS